MAGSSGYAYTIRLPSTAVTVAKSLIQVGTAAGGCADIVEICLYQLTKTSASELWEIFVQTSTSGGTVTAGTDGANGGTVQKENSADPAHLFTLGTTATGYNCTAEPTATGVAIIRPYGWNILNGQFLITDIPEGRLRIPKSGWGQIKLNTAPAASTNIGGYVRVIEYQ